VSVDPLQHEYPHYTPYQYAGNKPITFIDLDGLEEALPWYLSENKYGGKPVLTFGLGELSLVQRGEYVSGYPLHNGATFIENSLKSIWNNFATTWNEGIGGKTATDMMVEFDSTISNIEWKDLKKMSGNIETYENIAGHVASAILLKKIQSPNKSLINISTKQTLKPSFTSIELGNMGEDALKLIYGGEKRSFKTSLGWRYVDNLAGGVAYESKVGYASATEFIKKQFYKDIELLNMGAVDEVVWTFFRSPETGKVGASKPLLDMFEAAQKNGYNIRTQILELPK
jgi:hypothetical protein